MANENPTPADPALITDGRPRPSEPVSTIAVANENLTPADAPTVVSARITTALSNCIAVASSDKTRKSFNKSVKHGNRPFIPRPKTDEIYKNKHTKRSIMDWLHGTGNPPFTVDGLSLKQHGFSLCGEFIFCCGKKQSFQVTSLKRHIRSSSHQETQLSKTKPMNGIKRCFHQQVKSQHEPAPAGFKHRGAEVQAVVKMKRLELVRSYMRAGISLKKVWDFLLVLMNIL